MVAPNEWSIVTTAQYGGESDYQRRTMAYADGLWVVVARDFSLSPATYVVATASDPAGPWTNKLASTDGATYAGELMLNWGKHKWAYVGGTGIVWTTDDWDTHTVTPLAFVRTGYTNDFRYDGTHFATVYGSVYYASSINGTWNSISASTVHAADVTPWKLAYDGNGRWVSWGATRFYRPVIATTTNIAGGAWSTPAGALYRFGSPDDVFTTWWPDCFEFFPHSGQWVGGARPSTTGAVGARLMAFSDSENASSWQNFTPSQSPFVYNHFPYELVWVDGYFVSIGRAGVDLGPGIQGNAPGYIASTTWEASMPWQAATGAGGGISSVPRRPLLGLATDGNKIATSGNVYNLGSNTYRTIAYTSLSEDGYWGTSLEEVRG